MEIERESKKEKNFMWELTYPFPYENSIFKEKTMGLNNCFRTRNYKMVLNYHKEMKDNLNKFEYMIWQEWKEGYARYIENLIRDRLGINKNTKELQMPFNRVCFYEIGSRVIDLLLEVNEDLKGDIKELFYSMINLE